MRRKPPKYRTAEQAKQDRELKAMWEDILKKYPPVKITTTAPAKRPHDFLLPTSRRTNLDDAPSKGVADRPMKLTVVKTRLSPEMQAREKAAQKEIERKKKQTAPAYNKGGLQYISNPDDFKTMGRKV